MATDDPEVPLSFDEEPCLECPHDLTAHSRRLGCWLCDCTFGRPAAVGQGGEAAADSRYVQAWFLFVTAGGRPATSAADKRHVTIAVTRDCRVIVTRPPDVEALAPELEAGIAARTEEARALAARRSEILDAQARGLALASGEGHPCPDCGHELEWHSPRPGCWICPCTTGTAAASPADGVPPGLSWTLGRRTLARLRAAVTCAARRR